MFNSQSNLKQQEWKATNHQRGCYVINLQDLVVLIGLSLGGLVGVEANTDDLKTDRSESVSWR